MEPTAARRTPHCFSVDVEEYFQVANFDSPARRERWSSHEARVDFATRRLLDTLAAKDARATFFVLGWIAERHPGLVRAIAAAGHEVASHGYAHELLTEMTPDRFRADVRSAKHVLEDLIGAPVHGYRAPSLTITKSTQWALPILVEEGYAYDSSIIPVLHDRYGMPGSCPWPHERETVAGKIWEIPPSTALLGGVRIPVCGGGYLRQYPFPFFRWLLRRIASAGRPIVLFVHPWEVDPEQPRLDGSLANRIRHYRNLGRTADRVERLLGEFDFGPIRDTLPLPR